MIKEEGLDPENWDEMKIHMVAIQYNE